MMYGIHPDLIDGMEEDDVIELSAFIEKVEDAKIKKLAHEMALKMWGKKQ